jgi:hypothetical protein
MKKLRILAHDPGSSNYGISVIEAEIPTSQPTNLKFKILDFWKVNSTLQSLKLTKRSKRTKKEKSKSISLSPGKELMEYFAEVQHATHAYNIDLQIAERYMSRRMGGVTIELVNMELGVLRTLCMLQDTPLRMIPASQWKNEAARNGINLEQIYKEVKPFKVSPHEVDAVMIGLYGFYSLNKWKPYSNKNPLWIHKNVVSQIKKLRR